MPKDKKASELPQEKFVELPWKIVRDQIKEIFKPDIKNHYEVEYVKHISGDKWLVKLILIPMSFRYREGKDEADD